MDSRTTIATIDSVFAARWSADTHHRYVDLFRDLMISDKLSQRTISLKAGLSKTRVGQILHGTAEHRSDMYLHEFHRLLAAFDLDEMEALVLVNTYHHMSLARNERFRGLLALLAVIFRELPPNLLRRIEQITGFDGSEVHISWKDHIMGAVIDKVSEGVVEISTRKECPFNFDQELARRLELGSIS